MRHLIWVTTLLIFTATASVASVALGSVGARDAADVYLVFWLGIDADIPMHLKAVGVQELGPERALLAHLVFAEPEAHQRLIDEGYWVAPASAIAAICGIKIP